MTIRWVFGRRLGSNEGFSCLQTGEHARWSFIALVLCLLAGSLQGQIAPGSGASQAIGSPNTSSAARPAFPPGGGASAPAGYVLGPNDYVGVEVYGEKDLRTSGRLNPEGNLSVPLLGSIHLAGLTLTQATSKLTELYGRDYLVNPRVNISLVSYARGRFLVLGEVSRPGTYVMPDGSPGGIDLLEAIAMAGGDTRTPAPERTTGRRHNESGDQVFK